jgi:hypothetical protein
MFLYTEENSLEWGEGANDALNSREDILERKDLDHS